MESDNIIKIKVLVADDDTPTRILLRAAISQWGYETVEAKDGLEAWDILQKPDAPRIVILDWMMPKLDGIALCQRCRDELDTHPYIILLTQVSGTNNLVIGLEAGADEFLSKPFNMAELRSRLYVGSRIVNYENQLQTYLSRTETLTQEVLKQTMQLDAILNKDSFASNDNSDLKQIHHYVEKIINLVKDFKNNLK